MLLSLEPSPPKSIAVLLALAHANGSKIFIAPYIIKDVLENHSECPNSISVAPAWLEGIKY